MKNAIKKAVEKEQKHLGKLIFPMNRTNVKICLNNLGVEINKAVEDVLREKINIPNLIKDFRLRLDRGCIELEAFDFVLRDLKKDLLNSEEKKT